MSTMSSEVPPVAVLRLGDGMIVRLAGDLGYGDLPQLRRALLMPLPSGCRDVIVDAGEVTAADDAALAALIAARDWVRAAGGRFFACRLSPALGVELREVGFSDLLPGLGPPAPPADNVVPLRRMTDGDR